MAEGNRPRGAQKKRLRGDLKQVLKPVGIPYQDLESLTADRAKWHNLCKEGVASSKMEERDVIHFCSKMVASPMP